MVHSRSQVGWLALAGAAGALGLSIPACSSSFSGCESARSCDASGGSGATSGEAGAPGVAAGSANAGSAGTLSGGGTEGGGRAAEAGEAGESNGGADNAGAPTNEAGAGGEAPTRECVTDADCSDHLACNGTELCQAGACKPGVAPCTNPEPAHCDVLCAEVAGAASCTVRGQDKDKDGHFSSACVTKPGDDCNDAVASTHPGAPELCDGIDNDCDGKLDVSDGLAVGGSNVAIGPNAATRSLPAIAWATDKSRYGIAYRDTTSSAAADLYFEEVDKTGTVTFAPAAFNDTTKLVGANGPALALTWGGASFGAAWTSGTDVYFRVIGSDGGLSAAAVQSKLSTGPQPAGTAGGNWAVLYSPAYSSGGTTTIRGATVSATGVLGSSVILGTTGFPFNYSVAATGSNFAVATTEDGVGKAQLLNSSLAAPKVLQWSNTRSIVGSGPAGFAIVGFDASPAPKFSAFGPTGAVQCGPVTIADASFVPAGIVATSNGYLVVSSGAVRVQEVFANCTLGALFTLDAGPDSNVSIAGSSAGYGVVWQDTTAGVPKRRLFGPRYCD